MIVLQTRSNKRTYSNLKYHISDLNLFAGTKYTLGLDKTADDVSETRVYKITGGSNAKDEHLNATGLKHTYRSIGEAWEYIRGAADMAIKMKEAIGDDAVMNEVTNLPDTDVRTDLLNNISALSSTIDNRDEKIVELKEELTKQQTTTVIYKEQSNHAAGQEIAQLKADISRLRKALHKNRGCKDREPTDLLNNVNTLLSTIDKRDKEIADLKAELEETGTLALENENVTTYNNQARNEILEKLEIAMVDKNAEIQALKHEITVLKAKGENKTNERLTAMSNEYYKLQAKAATDAKKLLEAVDKIRRLRMDKQHLYNRYAMLFRLVNEYDKELDLKSGMRIK